MIKDILPMVSVIVPVYNKSGTVGATLKSVMEQTMNNLECIIVDDGSKDNSVEVIEKIIENDLRFDLYKIPNGGVANARNYGSKIARGKYICCLDSDDRIDPRFLEICVEALENDPLFHIAYTGLWYVKPNGEEGLSSWPDKFNYDLQLRGQNQIPTCNVARREVWERLGGQRQRYAPYGAGEEDAEMWLRAGAYGFDARKVSDAGLFIYSWMSGVVSGSKDHKPTDWRSWHPWVEDGEHPLASVASPKRMSHPVRQYDEPVISVIIPVGANHENDLMNVLDSLESQTFRQWEAIVVWDNNIKESKKEKATRLANMNNIRTVYPYIIECNTNGNMGAGHARNLGVEMARGSLIMFVDADDWLYPEAMEHMYFLWKKEQGIIYSDYVGKAFISAQMAQELGDRLLYFNTNDGEAVIQHQSLDFACEKAIRQPNPDMYIWCLVTTLFEKSLHYKIGGFDENMKSWEDWDYYIRMARAGVCFSHLHETLVVYRFYTGTRREIGLKEFENLITYLMDKYEGEEVVGCNCGKKAMPIIQQMAMTPQQQRNTEIMTDDVMKLVLYNDLNRGQHRVIGPSTRIDYGYRGSGEQFLVHRDDIRVMPHIFQEIEIPDRPILAKRDLPPAPTPLVVSSGARQKPLSEIPGITQSTEQILNAHGVHSVDELLEYGKERLVSLKGIGEKRAEKIIESAMLISEEK